MAKLAQCISTQATLFPEMHNAAPAEYVGQAALRIKLGAEIPSEYVFATRMPTQVPHMGERELW